MKIVPHNTDQEAVILARVLADRSLLSSPVLAGISEDTFYSSEHRALWQAIQAVPDSDLDGLWEWLTANGLSQPFAKWEGDLSAFVDVRLAGGGDLDRAVRLCRADASKRAAIAAMNTGLSAIYKPGSDPQAVLNTVQTDLHKAVVHQRGPGLQSMQHVASGVLSKMTSGTPPPVLPSGFGVLDQHLGGGFRIPSVNYLGARPSHGKTSFATWLAIQCAASPQAFPDRPNIVFIFSLEMSNEQLAGRALATLTGHSEHELWSALPHNSALQQKAAAATAALQNIYVLDTPNMTVAEIETEIHRTAYMIGHYPIMVVIDYVQLVNSGQSQIDTGDNHRMQVVRSSIGLVGVAKAAQCAVLCPAQFVRSLDTQSDMKPGLQHFAESDQLVRDANWLGGLVRPAMYKPDDYPADLVLLHTIKNRHAPMFGQSNGVTQAYKSALQLHGPTQTWSQYDPDALIAAKERLR